MRISDFLCSKMFTTASINNLPYGQHSTGLIYGEHFQP